MPVTQISIDGGTLAVEVEGPSDAPLIICSPGMGDTRDAYGPLAAKLVAAGFRVARLDLRGHGDSTAGFKHYGDEAIADDYLAIIGALGGSPAILAGASLSAGASVIAAGKSPESVAGLVLLGPFLRNGGSALMLYILRIALWWPWGPFVWRSYAATLWPGLGDKAKERAASSTALLQRPGRWSAFHATVVGANHNVVTPFLGKTKAPVLVVIGDKDPDWSEPLKEAEWVASNFTDAEIVTVPGAGHAPMFESPEVVADGLLKFLEKIQFGGKRPPPCQLAGPPPNAPILGLDQHADIKSKARNALVAEYSGLEYGWVSDADFCHGPANPIPAIDGLIVHNGFACSDCRSPIAGCFLTSIWKSLQVHRNQKHNKKTTKSGSGWSNSSCRTLSSVAGLSNFTSYSVPYPVVLSLGVKTFNGVCLPGPNATAYEFGPYEFGSWDSDISAFTPTKYLGTSLSDGQPTLANSCVVNYDNLGYILGTSSTLFNEGCAPVPTAANSTTDINQDLAEMVLQVHSLSSRDEFAVYPNPFYNYNSTTGVPNSANAVWTQQELRLVDGGEALQNNPIWPFLQQRGAWTS